MDDSTERAAGETGAAVEALVMRWRERLRAVGGMDNGLVGVPAAGVREMLDEFSELAVRLRTLPAASETHHGAPETD